jgi:hypothetical protein
MPQTDDSMPLLEHSKVFQEGASLYGRCQVSREKAKKSNGSANALSDHTSPEHDPSTCYLQEGGVTASGQRVRPSTNLRSRTGWVHAVDRYVQRFGL